MAMKTSNSSNVEQLALNGSTGSAVIGLTT